VFVCGVDVCELDEQKKHAIYWHICTIYVYVWVGCVVTREEGVAVLDTTSLL
jgi:hypothetical protein